MQGEETEPFEDESERGDADRGHDVAVRHEGEDEHAVGEDDFGEELQAGGEGLHHQHSDERLRGLEAVLGGWRHGGPVTGIRPRYGSPFCDGKRINEVYTGEEWNVPVMYMWSKCGQRRKTS